MAARWLKGVSGVDQLGENKKRSEQILETMRSVDPGFSFLDKLAGLQQRRDELWGLDDESESIKRYQCVFPWL